MTLWCWAFGIGFLAGVLFAELREAEWQRSRRRNGRRFGSATKIPRAGNQDGHHSGHSRSGSETDNSGGAV